ncbi:laminin-like protein epi-1 isoform X2 [Rhopilema esculentum]|uniref:laminin-like protein epi-1 isoform X2 n=1 Tax=Rhopilema esculentum TaxID=499914 RepID=UPI0031E176B8
MVATLSFVVLSCQAQFVIWSLSLASSGKDLNLPGHSKKLIGENFKRNSIAFAEEFKEFKRRSRREICTCHEKGTLYDLCHPLPAHNYKCICKGGYSGDFCDQCDDFFYGYPNCMPCTCNHFGSKTIRCHPDTGQCDCKPRVGGQMCDRCSSGYYRFPICQDCYCPRNQTSTNICNRFTGECFCEENFQGDNCEQCNLGYFGYPECKACSCNLNGSTSADCNVTTGHCFCKENFTGLKCDICLNPEMTGENCDVMQDSLYKEKDVKNETLVTEEKNVIPIVTVDEKSNKGEKANKDEGIKSDQFCDHSLSCQDGGQKTYSSCRDLFYNDTESRVSTCVDCGCFAEGTIASILDCDKNTGKCPCKSHVHGRTCDTCKDGYFDAGHGNFLGCRACQCGVGSSIGLTCENSGRCACKRNIEGHRCDRVRKGSYFLPSPYQLKYEFENGILDNGNPVAYEYSSFVFPDFSWKGYVPFGYGQENVTLKINVAKTHRYMLAVKYILAGTKQAFATVDIRSLQSKVLRQFNSTVKFDSDVEYRSKYATSPELSDIELTAGEWEIRVSSKSISLYLDHISLVQEEYYNPKQVLSPIPNPCNIQSLLTDVCSMYEHLNLGQEDFHSFPGNAGFLRERSDEIEVLDFEDPDMLRLLNLDGLAMISANQVAVYFNISVNATGPYKLVVEYFNADQRAYRIELIGQGTNGDHWMAAPCAFKFLCRSVVLTNRNTPSSLYLSMDEVITVYFTGTVEGMIGIHQIVAIPDELYTNEYIEPKFSCIASNGQCLDYPRLPLLQGSIPMVRSDNGHAFTAVLPSSSWFVLVLQYKQPQYTKFGIQITLKMENDIILRYLEVDYCPSSTGCRVKESFYGSKGKIQAFVRRPRKRDLVIRSISLQLDKDFKKFTLDPTHLDMTVEYQKSCLDSNSLPLTKNLPLFCKKMLFALSASINNGASSCRCKSRGSKGSKCDKFGGQCECGSNIIGRQCQSCRAGFYNYPYCRKCRCFMVGSQSPDCNKNGQCVCKPRYAGSKCGRCQSALFYNFPECKPCNCNTYGSLGLFCHSRTGQCQCLRNFRGRKCDKCQIGFHQFPNCIRCSCFAAGVSTSIDGGHTCYPGPNGQCTCKEHVMGDLCNQCKDLFYGLQMSKPLGCSPCKCHTIGTLNGVGICDKDTGRCPCKPNIDPGSRTCDSCKDGYYGLSKSNLLGCTACDCNPGGSLSNICEKKSGQCRCRPNVTGRRCDRLLDDTFYVPSVRHLKFKAKQAKTAKGKRLFPEVGSEFVAIAQHKAPVQWRVDIEEDSDFIFIMSYRMKNTKEARLDISISNAFYDYTVFSTSTTLKKTSSNDINSNSGLFILRQNGKDLLLKLYTSSYNVQLFTNTTDLYVDYVSLIPQSYLKGDKLVTVARLPCTVFGNSEPCVKYSYLSIPRRDFYTIEVESTGRQDAEMLDRSLYPSLNINGAILLRNNKPFTLSFKQPSTDSFFILVQYFKPDPVNLDLLIHINGPNGTQVAKVPLAYCPYEFACRHVLLESNSAIQIFKMKKDATYTVSFSTSDSGFVALDRVVLIPQRLWSFEFISPTPFCVAVDRKCTRTSPVHTKGHIKLHTIRSRQYLTPRHLPPNMLNPLLRPLYLQSEEDAATKLIRWNVPLERGYFFAVVHYFQPFHPSTTVKVIMNTFYASIAGKIELKFCPHVEGCRAAVTSEDASSDRFAGLYLSGSVISATIRFPKGFNVWINYIMFIHPSRDYSQESILHDRHLRSSETYKKNCIRNYDIIPAVKKSCFNWLFQLVMSYNGGPSRCECSLQGSVTPSCDLIGGQCQCKNHVTGRTCSQCAEGYWFYPLCRKAINL